MTAKPDGHGDVEHALGADPQLVSGLLHAKAFDIRPWRFTHRGREEAVEMVTGIADVGRHLIEVQPVVQTSLDINQQRHQRSNRLDVLVRVGHAGIVVPDARRKFLTFLAGSLSLEANAAAVSHGALVLCGT